MNPSASPAVIAWANGNFVDPTAALIAPTAYGLTIGAGLFETLAVYHGQIFALDLHLARLATSAQHLGLSAPSSTDLARACQQVAARVTTHPAARMRITVTEGQGPLGILGPVTGIDVSILIQPVTAAPPGAVNATPATALTSKYLINERSATAWHKTTSYLDNTLALRAASIQGAQEAIMFNTAGDLCEGATSNILVDLAGEPVTPALSSGCLPGVTRALLLRGAAQAGRPIRQAAPGELTRHTIAGAPMALLGTLRNLQVVAELDGRALPVSAVLGDYQQMFADQVASNCHPRNVG